MINTIKENNMNELANIIRNELGYASSVVVTAHSDYIRVWNCLTGSIMGRYNRDLESVAAAHGLKVRLVRTFGNGMTSAADWEDRLTPA
jgi:hypothetical protein